MSFHGDCPFLVARYPNPWAASAVFPTYEARPGSVTQNPPKIVRVWRRPVGDQGVSACPCAWHSLPHSACLSAWQRQGIHLQGLHLLPHAGQGKVCHVRKEVGQKADCLFDFGARRGRGPGHLGRFFLPTARGAINSANVMLSSSMARTRRRAIRKLRCRRAL
jgi:hypothetical protein